MFEEKLTNTLIFFCIIFFPDRKHIYHEMLSAGLSHFLGISWVCFNLKELQLQEEQIKV